jgi:uncharacterized protein YgiM (DUF1202 family)
MSGAIAEDTGRGARWLDRLAGVALLASVAAVAGAATPALLRVAGVGAPPDGYAELPRARAAAPSATATATHRFEFIFDADDEDKGSPTATPPGQAGSSWATPRMGLVRKKLELRDQASARGGIIGEVPAGAVVTVVKEQGEWVLIAQSGTDDMAFGWAPRSGVAVR